MIKTRIIGALAALFVLVEPMAAGAAAISDTGLSLQQGFGFKRDVPSRFGFVTSLTIGPYGSPAATALKPDILVSGPLAATKLQVVGVLSSFQWSGGVADPLKFNFNIADENRQTLLILLHTVLANTDVAISFVIFSYDPVSQTWYGSVGSSTKLLTGSTLLKDIPLEGMIAKADKRLELELDKAASGVIKSPENWGVSLDVAPAPVAQTIPYSTRPGMEVVKAWGITVQ